MRKVFAALAFGIVVTAGYWASAQSTSPVSRSFSPQLFEPAIGVKDTFFTIEPGTVGEHLQFGVGFWLNYQHKPFVIYTRDAQSGPFDVGQVTDVIDVIRNQLTADIQAAAAFHFGWFKGQLGVDLPVNLILKGADITPNGERTGAELSATGLGDLQIQVKVELFRRWHGLSLALSPIVTVPTGNKDQFGGDPNLSVRPRVVMDYQIGDFIAAINVGGLFREKAMILSSELGHRLLYGAAAGYQVHRRIFVLAELFGRAGFNTPSGCSNVGGTTTCTGTSATDLDAFNLEADGGARFNVGYGFAISAGAGVGLIKGIGSPQFRGILGVKWTPDFRDTDGDGVYDAEDKCPAQMEDSDNFRDEDGCPEPDNDEDLIPDTGDKCPNEAEDRDSFQDDDGCPDADNDADGIIDLKDGCPFQAENKNGIKDDDGCPDIPDADNDSVADSQDKCPKEQEDIDEFQDADGCPDPDNDEDEVPDSLDECPLKAEDIDKFKDEDGCPDPDNDGDGVLDARDRCPNEAEVINGVRDDDGCPDKGSSNVTIKDNKIEILKKIYFATAKSIIKPVSFSILKEVALTLRANAQIKGVRIEGHTDSQGKATKNKELSQLRAEAVRAYLIKQGIEPARLFAQGFGSEKPIADNRTGRGREENRRVEFVILEQPPGAQQ